MGLSWKNSEILQNPIINILDIMNIRSSMIQTMNHQLDLEQYHSDPLLNKTNIHTFYNIHSYDEYVKKLTSFIQT